MIKLIKSLPFQLFICIVISLIIANKLPLYWVRIAYTLSNLFIDCILFIIPWIISIYLFCAVATLPGNSFLLIISTFLLTTLSNLTALWTSFSACNLFLPTMSFSSINLEKKIGYTEVTSLININFPCILTTFQGIVLGIVLAIIGKIIIDEKKIISFSNKLSDKITKYLKRSFIPILPVYVFGFCLKMGYEDTLYWLFNHMFKVYGLGLCLVIIYVFIFYFISSKGSPKKLFKAFIPAGITGFATMSSAVAMPLSVEGIKSYTKNNSFSNFIIPATSNIHMISDDIMIVLFSQAFLLMNGMTMTDPQTFVLFSGAFCIAKFSCVGIPGASVMVILPVVEKYMGFSPEMIGLLTAVYILQDATGACLNIIGNGAFSASVYEIFKKIKLI